MPISRACRAAPERSDPWDSRRRHPSTTGPPSARGRGRALGGDALEAQLEPLRSAQDVVGAVLSQNDRRAVPMKGDAIRLIHVGLPHTRASLNAVSVQPRMPRVVAKQLNTTGDRHTELRGLPASRPRKRLGDYSGGRTLLLVSQEPSGRVETGLEPPHL